MTATKSKSNSSRNGSRTAGLSAQLRDLEKKAQASFDKLQKEASSKLNQVEKEAQSRWTQIEKEAGKLGKQANTRFGKIEQQARTNAKKLAKDLDRNFGDLQDQFLGLLGIATKTDVDRLSKKVATIARKVTGESDAA